MNARATLSNGRQVEENGGGTVCIHSFLALLCKCHLVLHVHALVCLPLFQSLLRLRASGELPVFAGITCPTGNTRFRRSTSRVRKCEVAPERNRDRRESEEEY
jgi:hypothetical protein